MRVATVLAALVSACGSTPESGPYVIATNENDGTISVIDTRARSVTKTIRVGKRPRGIRVGKDGLAYVAVSGSPKSPPGTDTSKLPPPDRSADGIAVVDLRRGALVRTIRSGPDPEAFDLAGDLLVVSNEDAGEASIVSLRDRRIRGRVPTGGEPEGVTTAPDGTVWVTSEAAHQVVAIDPVRARVLATIPTGIRPRTIAFTPDGALALVPGELDTSVTFIDARERRAVGRLTIDGDNIKPMGIAISRDGKRAYVTTGRGGSVAVIDVAARAVTKIISGVGKRPWGIALGRDGLLYTANGPSNDVSVIDPDAGRVVHRIRVGGSPWGVAVTP